MTKNILITGARSGPGKYFFSRFGGVAVTRATTEKEWRAIMKQSFDAIIHCAAATPRDTAFEQLPACLEDNVLLTRRVLQCSRRYFVYISSAWVYSTAPVRHDENEKLLPERARNFYTLTKMISESLIAQSAGDRLILRPCSLIGKEARRNNIMRLILEAKPDLSLKADSRYNLVCYQDIGDFIEFALANNKTGIFNVAAPDCLTLAEVAEITGHCPAYGPHEFNTDDISNDKVAALFPVFRQKSRQVLERFLKTL